MFKKPLLIFFFICWVQPFSCSTGFLFDIVQNGWTFLQLLNDVRSTKDTAKEIISIFTSTDPHQEIMESLTAMNHKLDVFQEYIKYKYTYIVSLIEYLPDEIAVQSKIQELDSFVVATNDLWNDLMSYMKPNSTEDMFRDLADNILDKLKLELQQFRHILIPFPGTITPRHQGLFMLLVENAHKKRDILCGQGETSHHTVVRLFYVAMTTEIKAHTLLFTAHLLKYSMNDGWRVPLETEFKEQFNKSLNELSKSLKIGQLPYIRSCDPGIWQINENYYGLYGYQQQTFYYLVGRNLPLSHDCMEIELGNEEFIYDRRRFRIRPLNKHARCNESPSNCTKLDLHVNDVITACAAEKGPYRIRFVRHHYKTFGTDKEAIEILTKTNNYTCPGSDYKRIVADSSRQSACSCRCPMSKVKLMMHIIHSNTTDNYVIVGLQIHKIKDYVYIQIAEGKLEANGYISNYSWVSAVQRVKSEPGKLLRFEKAGDIRELFFLGDSQLKPGYALTGIGFGGITLNDLNGFGVFIVGVKFDYSTGKLDTENTIYQTLQHGENHELEFPTKTPINKTEHEHTTPKSDGYTHVKLQPSDLSDDYGQTTLPLLDGVPILTNPLSPIGGVGLFYKGYVGDYAGFLSLRMFPVNYTHIMETFRESHDLISLLKSND